MSAQSDFRLGNSPSRRDNHHSIEVVKKISMLIFTVRPLISFHPEMALFRNLCACPVKCEAYFSGVNLRNYLCGVPLVRLRVIP